MNQDQQEGSKPQELLFLYIERGWQGNALHAFSDLNVDRCVRQPLKDIQVLNQEVQITITIIIIGYSEDVWCYSKCYRDTSG